MRQMQEGAYEKRGEQYLLIKSPPASGKSRALMFVALDKLANQGLKQAIAVVPESLSPPCRAGMNCQSGLPWKRERLPSNKARMLSTRTSRRFPIFTATSSF